MASKEPTSWRWEKWLQSIRVRAMTLEQKGAYADLLAFADVHGSLPADLATLQGLLGCSGKRFAAIWARVGPHWLPKPDDPTRLVNEEQERERVQRLCRSVQGTKASEARWSKLAASRSRTDLMRKLSGGEA